MRMILAMNESLGAKAADDTPFDGVCNRAAAERGTGAVIIMPCTLPIETMEAEQVNQIGATLSSLSVRAAELRRYL